MDGNKGTLKSEDALEREDDDHEEDEDEDDVGGGWESTGKEFLGVR